MAEVANRAEALVNGRRYGDAVDLCRRGLATDANAIELRLLLGRALMALHRDDEAEAELQECLLRNSQCTEAYRMLGELAFRCDRHRVAAEYLREATRLCPDDMASLVLLEVVTELAKK